MPSKHRTEPHAKSVAELKARLAEAEEALRAIRQGEIDAIVVSGPRGDRVYSLTGVETVYRQIVDTMQEAAFTVTFDGVFLYCNARFAELVKRPVEEIVGYRLQELVTREEREHAESLLRRGCEQPLRERLVFATRGGLAIPTHISSAVVDAPDGPSICIVATDLTELENSTEIIEELRTQQALLAEHETRLDRANTELSRRVAEVESVNTELTHEIAERTRAEQSLLASEERFQLATAASHVMVYDFDLSTRRVNAWHGLGELLGYAEDEAEPTLDWWDHQIHPDDLEGWRMSFCGLRARPRDKVLHYRLRHKDGRTLFVEDHATAIRDDQTQVVRIVGTAMDITARTLAQEELKQLNDSLEKRVEERTLELERRAEQLRELAKELTLAEQRERQRVSRVLHDELQQTLVAAKMTASLLKDAPAGREEAARLYGLIDQSLRTSRSLVSDLGLPVSLKGELLPALQWLVESKRAKYGLRVRLSCQDQLPPVPEDIVILLFQSARELLFNVVKHAGTKTAQMTAALVDGHIELIISDKGAGFDPSRLQPKRGKFGGMGLFGIRERLSYVGGGLEIESAPGNGSRFRLVTPLVAVEQIPATGVAQPPAPVTRVALRKRTAKIRILLADDHAIVRNGLSRLLQTERGMEVVGEASDGEAAVNLARELRPDVILMDVTMPKLNGVEATRIIHEEIPSVKIIGLSMHEANEHADAMRRAGATKYLVKSSVADALIQTIRGCTTGRNRAVQGTLTAAAVRPIRTNRLANQS